MKRHENRGRLILVLGLSGLLAACAGPSQTRPQGEMQAAQSAIQRAQSNDAREYEPLLLNQAQTKLADAELLIEDEKYGEARRLLEQAEVDAELAAARSVTERARVAAQQLKESIDSLSKQLDNRQP